MSDPIPTPEGSASDLNSSFSVLNLPAKSTKPGEPMGESTSPESSSPTSEVVESINAIASKAEREAGRLDSEIITVPLPPDRPALPVTGRVTLSSLLEPFDAQVPSLKEFEYVVANSQEVDMENIASLMMAKDTDEGRRKLAEIIKTEYGKRDDSGELVYSADALEEVEKAFKMVDEKIGIGWRNIKEGDEF